MTARAKAGTRWIGDFRSRYAAWWPGAAPLIEQHDDASASKSYPWPAYGDLGRPDNLTLQQSRGDRARHASPLGARSLPSRQHAGRAGQLRQAVAVQRDTLAALRSITTPGGHIELPYRWEISPVMWRGKPRHEGSNS